MVSSPIIIGGTDVATLQSAVNLNPNAVTVPTHTARADRFWSSDVAYAEDPTQEILEIDYAAVGITNMVSFDGVRFPHTINIEYSDSNGGVWTPLLDAITGQPIQLEVFGSYPPVLNDPSTISGHFHPQHDYEGHWTRYEVRCAVAQVQKLRFILQRSGGNGPVDVSNHEVAYSLALQNIDTGYRIESEDDIPFHLDERDSNTSGQVFANSADVFGSNLGFSKKTHRASNLIHNTDDNAPLIWKSEPQPVPYAVVNFYADMRDSQGNPQSINQIFIDPLYLGCSVNLYYSNDSLGTQFESSRQGLTASQAVFNGAKIRINGPLDLGTWHTDETVYDGDGNPYVNPAHFDPYFVQFDNFSLGFDPSLDWWLGLEWTRNWTKNTDSLDHALFSCDAFTLGQNQDSFYLSTCSGDLILIDNFTDDNEPIQILAAHSGGRLRLSIQQGTELSDIQDSEGNTSLDPIPRVRSLDMPISHPIPATIPGQFLVGTDSDATAYAGGFISSFTLKQETYVDDDFLSHPSAYSAVPLMPTQESLGKYNALVRFDTSQLGLSNSTGFIGGPAFSYENMSWTPIPRSYEMQRGYMKLPLTSAKFWNLEISNLRPENNEKYVPVKRSVKFFPPSLFPATPSLTSATTRQSDDDIGTQVQQAVANSVSFADTPQYTGTGMPLSGVTNTEVYVATDSDVADRLATLGNQWKYQQFHADRGSPSFTQAGPHVYQVEERTQTTSVSYFAGLRNIFFARTSSTSPQNRSVIEESFHDIDAVAEGNWIPTEDGSIISGVVAGPTYTQSTSVSIPTQTNVRGLQFAAQQTDSQEIEIFGDFSHPDYDPQDIYSWNAYGDGKSFGFDTTSTGQHAFVVSRESTQGYWADVPLNWGQTYAEVEAAGATWAGFMIGSQAMSEVGGVQSTSIVAPYGGRLYVAIRATASQSLSAPLWVQVVDTDTGKVLTEAQSNVSKNEIKQWYASLDVAQFGAVIAEKWGDLIGPKVWPKFVDTFARTNAPALGFMDSGQAWSSPVGVSPLSIASNAATVAVAGAQSDVDTSTPWGTMSVRFSNIPTTTIHSAAVPVLDLGGGLLLLNDSTIVDQNIAASNFATLGETLTTTHDYNFKFMLTSQVPSGQVPGGIDATIQAYSIVISTGTLGSDTWLKTISTSHAFQSQRVLTGPLNTAYTSFTWTPSNVQVLAATYLPGQFSIPLSSLVTENDNYYDYNHLGQDYTFRGVYSYDTVNMAVRASSIYPSGSVMSAPTISGLTPSGSGGVFAPGSYYYRVSALNALGETAGSAPVSATVVEGGTINVGWTAVTGATSYNVYRGTTTGATYLIGSSATTSLLDTGDTNDNLRLAPLYNSTNGAGTMQVTDVKDNFGSFRVNVSQMPSNMAAGDVRLLYLDYNPTGGTQTLTLWGDGTIRDEVSGHTLATLSSFNPLAGPLTVHYVHTSLLSSAFKTAHPMAGPTAILIFQNGTTYLGGYSSTAASTWLSTSRGIGGANNGTAAGQYTIIEGFNWNAAGASLSPDSNNITWGQVDYASSRTYAQMEQSVAGTTENIAVRVVQKSSSNDTWFVQSAALFWDPVVWEFSCDDGETWWEASAIRNDPRGVILFPPTLADYSHLKWRVTSYAGRVAINHIAIRPWYVGQHGYAVPAPAHVPQGPNLNPMDEYAPIERDPRWMAWDKPIPHWWWSEGIVASAK